MSKRKGDWPKCELTAELASSVHKCQHYSTWDPQDSWQQKISLFFLVVLQRQNDHLPWWRGWCDCCVSAFHHHLYTRVCRRSRISRSFCTYGRVAPTFETSAVCEVGRWPGGRFVPPCAPPVFSDMTSWCMFDCGVDWYNRRTVFWCTPDANARRGITNCPFKVFLVSAGILFLSLEQLFAGSRPLEPAVY